MKKHNLLITLTLTLTLTACVCDKYQTTDGSDPSKQRQPWGDDTFWPYYWRCSTEGKYLVKKNARVEEYYRTNKFEGFKSSTNK